MKLISVLFLVKTKLDFGFKAGFFFIFKVLCRPLCVMKLLLFFSDGVHIAPTVGLGDFGKEASVDQIYLAGPPLPLTRRWDFAKRWTQGFQCRRPSCWKRMVQQRWDDNDMWMHV